MTKPKKPLALVDEKIAFAEKHIRNKEGQPWSLKGREWVRDEFWLPADGWKLWRFEDVEPCDVCADQIGDIIGHPSDNPTTKCKCGGLCAEPILVTVLNLERGDGKTFNLMAYSIATIFKAKNKSMSAIWASEDQGARIFDENWGEAVRQSKVLSSPKRSKIHGTPPILDALGTKSRIEVLTASHRSNTGGRRTHILADEARDIHARTFMALLPSTNAMHGVECPSGHVQLTPEDVESMGKIPLTCSACGRRLSQWWPRVIVVSAAGVLGGNERDWLFELIEKLTAEPHKNYHLFTSASWGKTLNPRKSEKVSSAMTEVFGSLPSTRQYAAAEYGDKWVTPGEDALTPADIKRVMDGSLHNLEDGTSAPSIGFLDTSLTREKTSIVILTEEPDCAYPWERVYLSFLDFWWPGHGRCKSWRTIKPDPVKLVIESVLPLYPGMVKFVMDLKTGAKKQVEEAWPVILFRELRKGAGEWRKKIEPWKGTEDNSDIGWDLLLERTIDETIRLQKSKEIIEEIKGVMISRPKNSDKRARVVDRNRAQMHKDITQSLADLCYLIKKEQLKGTRPRYTREQAAARSVTNLLRGGTRSTRIGGMNMGPDGM